MTRRIYNILKDKNYFLEKCVKIITKSGTAYVGYVRDFNEYAWELESDSHIEIVRSREIEAILIDKEENDLTPKKILTDDFSLVNV